MDDVSEAVRYVPRPRRPSLVGLACLLHCVHAQQVDRLRIDRPTIPAPTPCAYAYTWLGLHTISWMSCHVYLICADVPQDHRMNIEQSAAAL